MNFLWCSYFKFCLKYDISISFLQIFRKRRLFSFVLSFLLSFFFLGRKGGGGWEKVTGISDIENVKRFRDMKPHPIWDIIIQRAPEYEQAGALIGSFQ